MKKKKQKIEFLITKECGPHFMGDTWFQMLEIQLGSGERCTGLMVQSEFDDLLRPEDMISAFGDSHTFRWVMPVSDGISPSPCFILSVSPYDLATPPRPEDQEFLKARWARMTQNGGFEFDD